MCTTFLVGKKASYDGSTLAARIEDSANGMFKAKKFIVVEPKDQPVHYKSVRTDCEITLPANPLRYTCLPNVKKWRGVWGACGINSKNVTMTATETTTTNDRVLGADPLIPYVEGVLKNGGIGEEDFIVIVLPYITSAREGVERLGALIEKYGTYESNAVVFQDVDEIWWFESIGGHHWLARRVPDDCYVVGPNQFGVDSFDFADAYGTKEFHMCAADLQEFVQANHLDCTMEGDFDPRAAFGSDSEADHVYNTPRAWVMHRKFNGNTYDFDSADTLWHPESNKLPWAMRPEHKLTIADVKDIMSNHYEGTPFDPYSRHGDTSRAGCYRPIGINRNDVLAITQIRPYLPEEIRAVEWLAFGCNVFNAIVPFYGNVNATPEYLANTTLEPTTENFYWVNRIIATICDPHFGETKSTVETYQEDVLATGNALLKKYDEAFLADKSKIADVAAFLQAANTEMADYLKQRTTKYLDDVLFTASALMKNTFARSDAR
ncbi:dipeptidase [Mageeibacillus indolicus UPII9-5]|uniref:Dipeptidase n=1 Tax=Mageeibacillus indolicus (strain UPII9-5) TaxID=699246 RepID=D3QZH5_MAGIU|nr:C69 family dipeptidase [Mageeibacillus indolicus]ADC91343.1 dipeptidase [Mageeibacillus indolicus UPII9-5]